MRMYPQTLAGPPKPPQVPPPARPSAAVIGAAGFIGRPLVEALEADGVRVARFTRSRPALRDGRLHPELRSARTIFFVATNIDPARAAAHAELGAADRRHLVDLLAALRAGGQRPTLIFASSGGTVYDPTVEPPYHEGSPTRPTIAYGRWKLRMERELLARAGAVRPVILRLANIYGPGQRANGGVVARWLASVAGGQPVDVFGNPRAARDYLYVDDTVEAMVRVRHRFAAGSENAATINIGSGAPVMLEHLVDVISAGVGRPIDVRLGEGRTIDRLAYWLDVSAATRLLGWRPRTSLEVGVRRTWHEQWVRAVPALAG
jgi:UDP-glucose 4-epimerase